MRVTMAQQPVGQGGLFEGCLEADKHVLRWVYDCGSSQLASLRREIRQLSTAGQIDLLFISHLDSDHINGLDELLRRVSVSEIVLPYLKELDLALMICRDSENGRLTALFENFASDPAAWFLDRGVATVSFIRSKRDDSPPDDGPDRPNNPLSDLNGPLKYKWSRHPNKLTHGNKACYFDTDASIWISRTTGLVDWIFAPYAHRPPARGAHAFLDRLRSRFGRRPTIQEISAAARTRSGRDSLRYCYDAIWIDHNFVSMSLYSGTVVRSIGARAQSNGSPTDTKETGWLSTGDSNLAVIKRRATLLRHYSHLGKHVGCLVLPHHGASNNFHVDVMRALSNLSFGIAAAGPNSYGHPHRQVQNTVRSFCQFHQVSDVSASRLSMSATF